MFIRVPLLILSVLWPLSNLSLLKAKKMNIKKYIMLAAVAMSFGFSSCVGDLDLEANDPNLLAPTAPDLLVREAMECYQSMATSGQEGPGSSIISGLDNGRGQYTRALFMMNEFPTDEVIWMWKDDGIYDLITNTFDATNGNIYGTYSRLYAHIALCNQFLADAEGNTDPEIVTLRDEIRTLRAMSYYWVVDIFGKASMALSAPDGTAPEQVERYEAYDWLEKELVGIVDNGNLSKTPVYGRIGLDAAEGLLSRLYLNAEVYTKDNPKGAVSAWDKCAERCENIIARHTGGGYLNSGLASQYLYLFCRDNHDYMPGGANKAENEILWGVPFDSERLQSYGGTMFLINAALADGGGMSGLDFGCSNVWQCMKAPQQFSEKFTDNDKRWALWVKGTLTYTDDKGQESSKTYSIENTEFSNWGDGYVCVKWSGLNRGNDYFPKYNPTAEKIFNSNIISTQFTDTDLALIRLSEIYLNYAECALHNGASKDKGLQYVNLVRSRGGVNAWTMADFTADNLLAERSRELYWELTRRSDLVRFGKFTGPDQLLWSWKGNELDGNQISTRYDVMPIPVNVIAAQPNFKQNKGY